MFNAYYQTYGRTVELKFLRRLGVQHRRGDRPRRRGEGGRGARRVRRVGRAGARDRRGPRRSRPAACICLGCPGHRRHRRRRCSRSRPAASQTRMHLVEYIVKKLAGKPADSPATTRCDADRAGLRQLYLQTAGGNQDQRGRGLRRRSSPRAGVDARREGRRTSSTRPASRSRRTSAIAKFKAAGVTTVDLLRRPDRAWRPSPRRPPTQDYFPEWVLRRHGPRRHHRLRPHLRPAAVGPRVRHQLAGRPHQPEISARRSALQLVQGRGPAGRRHGRGALPAAVPVLRRRAGGRPEPRPSSTFRARAVRRRSDRGPGGHQPGDHPTAITASGIRVDYYGIDDFTEVWWDPTATGPDEIRKEGTGMCRFVDGGKRYLPGEWTERDQGLRRGGHGHHLRRAPAGREAQGLPQPRRLRVSRVPFPAFCG